MKSTKQILVLGSGYVGSRLVRALGAMTTHSSPEKASKNQTIYFNLQDALSWKNLPKSDAVVWTFPALPLASVQAFYNAQLSEVKKLIVCASTSCYQVTEQNQLLTEETPLDLGRQRVIGEEWLREQGATILTLAGIHGPNREPINWLRKNLIKTPQKRVNLVHVDDIVTITCRLLEDEREISGQRFNLTDGEGRFWQEIADHYDLFISESNQSYDSKRISNEKIVKWLKNYHFKTLY
jgi:nucleoside-diphosphate-sugar epimerase